jgi:hypothetical protein
VDGGSWARWRPEIAKACDGSHHTIESIDAEIEAGRLIPLTNKGCIYLVRVLDYPTERSCQVEWAAGDLEAILAGMDDLHTWARARDCTEMLVEGHPGWKRALESEGYGQWSVTLRRPL